MIYEQRECLGCQSPFEVTTHNKKFCNVACRSRYEGTHATSYLAKGNAGAISEIVVCSELLKKGYDVFRSVSQCARLDLVAIKRDNPYKTYTIEVRTGHYYKTTNKLNYNNKGIHAEITAVVIQESNEIVFIPKEIL